MKAASKRWRSFSSLAFSLVLFVLGVMFVASVLSGIVMVVLYHFGLVDFMANGRGERRGIPLAGPIIFIGLAVLLGTAIAAFFSRRALRPIRLVIEAMHQVAAGDFQVQVDLKGILELEELSESFNKMTAELASIDGLRSDFVDDFSHELRTPIASLRGFAQLLKDGDLSEGERQEYLDIIITESERLARLATNILALSKYESMGIITEKSQFRLDEQIRRTILLAESEWAARDIQVDVLLDEVSFVGNEDLTEQIWINLLDNAIKFCEDGGEIRVRANEWNHGIRVTIADTGFGMDQATQARIFDQFYQADAARAGAGNGLGLAIVKRIVELHGGVITVDSEPGRGSAFTVDLPQGLSRQAPG
ncbi:MAG: HAMP domain-containing histidine kinase [Propionibacteriaceae bacterium]|jgi:signal transduction histidine kinase|nr:HAMP domain-containing histidine kinase [Propionibacteriaceae bacterium]